MNRRHLAIACEGSTLAATLDLPDGLPPATTGLLIVSGGNEIRSGAWGGQARFAARFASAGHACLRFDRRGIGDSDGPNGGFTTATPDITAAIAALRAAVPEMRQVVVWGNCDAASALMLAGGAGADGLILSNPWTFEHDTSADGEETAEAPEMPAGALRAHYRSRLATPAAIKRLRTGHLSLGSLVGSLLAMLRPAAPPSSLAQNMAAGIAGFTRPVAFLIAEKDRTAQAFLGGWPKADGRVKLCPGASHSFVEEASQEWLVAQVLGVLKGF